MARWYTVEQACKAILSDDDLGEMESADSLDESFNNTSSSCSEIDSDPENDYCGIVINVVKPPERGRPRPRTLNAQHIRGRVRVRGGRSRGIRTRGGNNNMLPSIVPYSDITNDDFPFNERPDLKIDIPDNASPMFFGLILTDEFVESLVSKTNEYANRLINANRPLRRRSIWKSWTDVNIPDMKKFIGLIFSVGLISLPSYEKY